MAIPQRPYYNNPRGQSIVASNEPGAPQLSHCGVDVLSDGVTSGQPGRPVRQDEYVVEVAARLGTPSPGAAGGLAVAGQASPARGARGVAARRPATPRGVAGAGKFARQAVAASFRAP
jgi:hypothetical protein